MCKNSHTLADTYTHNHTSTCIQTHKYTHTHTFKHTDTNTHSTQVPLLNPESEEESEPFRSLKEEEAFDSLEGKPSPRLRWKDALIQQQNTNRIQQFNIILVLRLRGLDSVDIYTKSF